MLDLCIFLSWFRRYTFFTGESYGLRICILAENSSLNCLKDRFVYHKYATSTCISVMFLINFLDFILMADDSLVVSKWCKAKFLQIVVIIKLIYILAWGRVHFLHILIFGWTIPLQLKLTLCNASSDAFIETVTLIRLLNNSVIIY